ncbi:hypothetical protein PROFUN_15620 [Planoprotostelium fungivorum]|uniref:Cation/H+ exchanger domain-containing protein n=1 Tax=Planoprotostelium fungivorum TaxID=1890364 RepID=A0A2P6MVN2_9EUKA|nr:hypothetical protein PROFUN_15620 [Planoprotostelium fungivorum]
MQRKSLWLDCDPGQNERLNLLGVSTVAGNQTIDKTTRNALQILELSGLQHIVEVYKGQGSALLLPPQTCPEIHGTSGMDCTFILPPVVKAACPQKAVLKLAEVLENAPEPITIVCTGPLTNIALLISLYPELKPKIEQLVLMGGSVGVGNIQPAAEYNILIDPESARIVFESGLNKIVMVPLEVTHTALSTSSVLNRISDMKSNFSMLMVDFLTFFGKTYLSVFGMPDPPVHDPTAVAYLISPEIFTTKLMRVDIETQSKYCNGRTVCDIYNMSPLPKNVHVALSMDVEEFWNLMVSALERSNQQSSLNSVHETKRMTGSSVVSGGGPTDENITIFLVQLCIVVTLSRVLAWLFRYIKQPAVIAEVVAGIILGPSALGRIDGYVHYIFPPTTHNPACTYPANGGKVVDRDSTSDLNLQHALAAYGPIDVLSVFANFGLILFMFIIGLELDTSVMKRNLKEGLAISISAMVLPFGFGSAIAYAIWTTIGTPTNPNVQFSTFLVFVSVAMSITAFPVLARILSETRLMDTKIGNLALAAAALNDVIAWILLAVVVGIANAQSSLGALYTLLILVGFVAVMILIVRPLLTALAKSRYMVSETGELTLDVVAAFLIGIFVCAWFTQIIGVDVIFGGFVMGVAVPRVNHLPERFLKSIEDIVVVLLLPLYFTNSGLKTNIGTLSEARSWGIVALVITAACCGKIWAGLFSARFAAKATWRESWTIGFLMNTKGLVELIVLNVGLQAGVLNTEVFTVFVLMALITTFITSPAVHFIYLRKRKQRETEGDGYKGLMSIRDVSVIPWVTDVLPSLLARDKIDLRLFILKEISDRPSTYMVTEFSQMLASLGVKRRGENTANKALATRAGENCKISGKILASARLSHDLLQKCIHKTQDIVITEIKIAPHALSLTRPRSETNKVNLIKSSSIADHLINHYDQGLGIFIHKTDIKNTCTKVLFVYEGRSCETLSLDFVTNLVNNNTDISVLCLASNDSMLKMPEREGCTTLLVDSPTESFTAHEEHCDLIIMGGDRSSNLSFRSAALRDSPTPILMLFPPVVGEMDSRRSFQLNEFDMQEVQPPSLNV